MSSAFDPLLASHNSFLIVFWIQDETESVLDAKSLQSDL